MKSAKKIKLELQNTPSTPPHPNPRDEEEEQREEVNEEELKHKKGKGKEKLPNHYVEATTNSMVESFKKRNKGESSRSLSNLQKGSSSPPLNVQINRVRKQARNGELLELKSIDEVSLGKDSKCIVYWMSREQRVNDNWAILFAQQLSEKFGLPLVVCFCLPTTYLDAGHRQWDFLLKGLAQVENTLREKSIPFHLLLGNCYHTLPPFVQQNKVGAVVTDFNPLRINVDWNIKVCNLIEPLEVSLYRVDSRNIVPVWVASNKLEYAARTIRTKIHNHLNDYIEEFPQVKQLSLAKDIKMPERVDWEKADAFLQIDRTIKPVDWIKPGEEFGLEMLQEFIEKRLKSYSEKRNDPTIDFQSGLSPYLHFGQISSTRCILEVQKYKKKYPESVESFIEELVVRRELSDNFCYYQKEYDSFSASWEWAKQTLDKHKPDKREYVYTLSEFELGLTHEDLWNAAQLQMVETGKMHGFMRMYWAKKILEWSESPEMAIVIATYLNDKYEIDGRDSNGYVGILWAVEGVHDRAWTEREIFGKIRYMNYEGCKRKFDIKKYISQYPSSVPGSLGFIQNKKKAEQLDKNRLPIDEYRTHRELLIPFAIHMEENVKNGTEKKKKAGNASQ